MADASIAAGAAAGSSSISRTSGASGQGRVSALRPVSALAPTPQAFSQNLAIARPIEVEAPTQVITSEPGTARLSSNVQLILAETRTQEDQSDFVDRSTLDQAANSYAQGQAAVRETIGIAQIAAANSNTPATNSQDTSA
ncbi:MAG: hypothetical protein JJ850_16750 [Kordiimonadaceae bacterium]|nr:hypothetical protein [Kordiimonadaceae bacterium]MBO6569740.1 hypothetical protein [Kordiimonadaceae bacterium]MBO6966275.1 hypothetical protein [Kordiimonadaceae bacterium]